MASKNRKGLNTRNIFLGSAIFVFFIVVFIFASGNNEVSIPHHNIVDTKISQYSDGHITLNAVATNPNFKDIAFETPPVGSKSFLGNQIATVVNAIKSLTKIQPSTPKESGTWIWTPVMSMTPQYMDSIISGAKANGINTIYVSVDSYLDIFTMQKGAEREKQKKAFGDKLENFITLAGELGIAVDAEAGWRNWAEGDNVYKAFAVVSYVKNFNDTHQNKFRGFQYDVEPYLLDSYGKDSSSVLKNFVALVDNTQYYLATSTLQFAVAVPAFYDEKDKMTPKFSYAGQKDYVFTHLLNVLDKRPNSSIIIMSYRNLAIGDDSTVEISSNEMQTAKKGNYNTKIIIAQETGDIAPPYITFYNTSKKYLFSQIGKINNALGPYPNFGGIAIHYENAFLALK
jgi:hypothetical protein